MLKSIQGNGTVRRLLSLAVLVAIVASSFSVASAAQETIGSGGRNSFNPGDVSSEPARSPSGGNSQQPAAPPSQPLSGYFVSTSGSDSGPGTVEAPFRTLTHAMKQLRAGDTLWVRGGEYRERVLLRGSDLRQGTADARITVNAYPGERPVVVGLFWLSNASYWTIDGVNVTWDSATGNREEHMMRFYGGTGMMYQNAELWGARSYSAILVTNNASNWVLRNLYVHDTHASNGLNQDHLIYISGASSGTIEHCLLVNAPNGRGIKLGQHIDGTRLPENVTVRYNTIVNANGSNVSFSYDARNNQVYGNILVGAGSGYANVGSYRLYGGNNVARDNITWDGVAAVKSDGVLVDGGNRVMNPNLNANFVATNPELVAADGKIAYGHLAGTDLHVALAR